MIDLSKYRIIDLSHEIIPGERKTDGRYLHGEPKEGRPVEVQEFESYGARMHMVQGQTHTGTHTEAMYKYSDTGPDMASMPITSFLGEAAACNFTHKKAGEPVNVEDFKKAGVRPGDIVIAWGSSETAHNPPYPTFEALDWLIETGIKSLVIENLLYAPPDTPYGVGNGDARLILAGVPIVDAPVGLDQIKKPRVFFIALPVKIRRVTAFWTRAIVLEEID